MVWGGLSTALGLLGCGFDLLDSFGGLQIGQVRLGLHFPHVFDLIDLLGLDFASRPLFQLCGESHKLFQKCLVLN